MRSAARCCLYALVIFYVAKVSMGIRLTKVDVPTVAAAGDSVTLLCEVDLEEGDLYAVKWYKDGEEFYRFAPRRDPSIQAYHVEGVHVDKAKSRAGKVVLRSVSLSSSGSFRCEASAEAPSFSSVQGGGIMVIIIPPKTAPQIFGGISTNASEERLELNCTTDASRPPSVVRWYINGVQVDPELSHMSHTRLNVTGLETTVSTLQLSLGDRKFFWKSGSTSVICEATVIVPLPERSRSKWLETSLSAWTSESGGSKKFHKHQETTKGRTSSSTTSNSFQSDRLVKNKAAENLNLVTRSEIVVYVNSVGSELMAAPGLTISSFVILTLSKLYRV